MNEYDIKMEIDTCKIYINKVLHLAIKRSSIIGVQTWIEGEVDRKYVIEFTTTSSTIVSEYDDIEKWKAIIGLIDRTDKLFVR